MTWISKAFPNPLALVALINGICLLSAGVVFSILIFPYKFPSDSWDPTYCARHSFPIPIGLLCAGCVWLLYWFLVTFKHNGKTTQDHYDINNHYRVPIGFLLFNLVSAALLIIPSSFGLDVIDSCGDRSVLVWGLVLTILPIAGCSIFSSLFYILGTDRLACIPTRSARYWVLLYPITVFTMWWWCLLCCTHFDPSQLENSDDGMDIQEEHRKQEIISPYANSARDSPQQQQVVTNVGGDYSSL